MMFYTYDVVSDGTGNYAVRRRLLWMFTSFLSTTRDYWWTGECAAKWSWTPDRDWCEQTVSRLRIG